MGGAHAPDLVDRKAGAQNMISPSANTTVKAAHRGITIIEVLIVVTGVAMLLGI